MNNTQRLGNVLTSRMKKTSAAAVPMTIELGTINSNLSLTTDSLPTPIPKGDYMINLMLAGDSNRTSSEAHTPIDSLQAGDRVLVAWCGNEPVVMAIVVSS